MNIFARPEYESEFTQFLNTMRTSDAGVAQRQHEGRALLWDKAPLDLEERQRNKAATVKRGAYVYA